MRPLTVIFMLALMAATVQPPTPNYHDTLKPGDDEYNVPPNETRIPPGHYCTTKAVYDYNAARHAAPNAHPCDCKMVCAMDNDGNLVEQEAPECLAYCHINNRRCTCHTEQPCPGSHDFPSQHAALVDMNQRVVAVLRGRR